jgi:hypothetical protein
MTLAMNCATVDLPQPAGPVISQIWWCLVSARLELAPLTVPLDIVLEDVEMGRWSGDAGFGWANAGRFS